MGVNIENKFPGGHSLIYAVTLSPYGNHPAKNQEAAMDVRVVDPLEGLSIHPELDHLWQFESGDK